MSIISFSSLAWKQGLQELCLTGLCASPLMGRSAAQGMKEQGQRTRQLRQAQQQADVATASNTSAAAAAAAVLNALVEGTQQQGLRRGAGDPSAQDPSKSGAGELQQGINRLVALLEGSSSQQATTLHRGCLNARRMLHLLGAPPCPTRLWQPSHCVMLLWSPDLTRLCAARMLGTCRQTALQSGSRC